jgi:predicted nuclease of predicted toxin-antitoxin system
VRFIVDAQLPKSLCNVFIARGIECTHTLDLTLKNRTSDSDIIAISKKESRIVITKDSDFLEMFLIK